MKLVNLANVILAASIVSAIIGLIKSSILTVSVVAAPGYTAIEDFTLFGLCGSLVGLSLLVERLLNGRAS